MLDKKLNPYRDDIAAIKLKGEVIAQEFREPVKYQITSPRAKLSIKPENNAEQETEILYGEIFEVYEIKDGFAWGQATLDNYVGYVEAKHLSDNIFEPKYKIKAQVTHAFEMPRVQAKINATLSINSFVNITDKTENGYIYCEGLGYIYGDHICPIDEYYKDPIETAERFLELPYTWGGKSGMGVDCSGLVQSAFSACGIFYPRDAYMQEKIGTEISFGNQEKADLVFWKGHVAICIDKDTIIHANAHHMKTAIEPLEVAIKRTEAKGIPVTSIKRFSV